MRELRRNRVYNENYYGRVDEYKSTDKDLLRKIDFTALEDYIKNLRSDGERLYTNVSCKFNDDGYEEISYSGYVNVKTSDNKKEYIIRYDVEVDLGLDDIIIHVYGLNDKFRYKITGSWFGRDKSFDKVDLKNAQSIFKYIQGNVLDSLTKVIKEKGLNIKQIKPVIKPSKNVEVLDLEDSDFSNKYIKEIKKLLDFNPLKIVLKSFLKDNKLSTEREINDMKVEKDKGSRQFYERVFVNCNGTPFVFTLWYNIDTGTPILDIKNLENKKSKNVLSSKDIIDFKLKPASEIFKAKGEAIKNSVKQLKD